MTPCPRYSFYAEAEADASRPGRGRMPVYRCPYCSSRLFRDVWHKARASRCRGGCGLLVVPTPGLAPVDPSTGLIHNLRDCHPAGAAA